ncbi:Rec8 like protein-domain-containing protein [Gilbertella persicaria]|uniref:Rec8 like protein-domain-containing protein n=1 Tax=Gilbertella persicaria TaxID=101096 RepID=UPI00222063D9|nr:Rec8 like protein-domain-containing protein [Gilbertella persicaria]KAI8095070.1 Rec8 like protein-domain-containing protein [Gilbertella persicaria]
MISDQLRTKQGPLARVWLASHWEKKISKSQFLQTNLEKTIETITTNQDEEPLTLRVSGQLLLGVVRIYSRKTRYLLEDCNEALTKIKLAFKKGEVNMPDIHHSIANVNTITLQDKLTEFDILLPDLPFHANVPASEYDPIFDSLGDISMSQDINLNDLSSFNFGNYDTERGLNAGIEVGRRDNEAGLTDTGFDMDAIADPMKDMNLNDNLGGIGDDGVNFDFDLNDGADYGDDMNAEPAQFDLPALPTDSLDNLMEVGIVEDDNMFGIDELSTEPTVRRRKRLVVDKVTEISQEDLRRYTLDTSAIISTTANLAGVTKQKTTVNITKPFGDVLGSELNNLFSGLNRKRRASGMISNLPKEPRLGDVFTSGAGDAFNFDDDGYDFGGDAGINEDALKQFDKNNGSDFSDYDPFMAQNTQTFNSSTRATLENIENQLTTQNFVNFNELAMPSISKKSEAARMFYDVLLLSTKDKIKVKQDRPFGEIQISAPTATVY